MKKLKELVRAYNQQKSANNHLVRRLKNLLYGVSITCEDTMNGKLGDHLYQLTHRTVPEVRHPFSLAERIISYDVFTLNIYNLENELLLSMDIGYEYSKYSITLNLYKSDKLSEEKIEQIIRTIVK